MAMKTLADALEVMKQHAAADRLVQGAWLAEKDYSGVFRGCFFGCAMQTGDEAIEEFCRVYDLPLRIGNWAEQVFENLPADEAKQWPVQCLTALVNAGDVDYEALEHKLAIKRLTPLVESCTGDAKAAVEQVIEYHNNPSEDRRPIVRSAARKVWSEEDNASGTNRAALRAARWATWSLYDGDEALADAACSPLESEWQRERDNFLEILGEG